MTEPVSVRGASPSSAARASQAIAGATADAESRRWLERLGAQGAQREEAVAELHALLLRAARFEVHRRSRGDRRADGGHREDIALQAADDALVAVLGKLDDFRGESRFTTWAYKFALLHAAVRMRRRAWQDREIPLEQEAWGRIADAQRSAQARVEERELLGALREAVEQELTPHQREVLVALALNDVPIDVLAERLNTSRGALYKALHDGRRKLRSALAARGLRLDAAPEEAKK